MSDHRYPLGPLLAAIGGAAGPKQLRMSGATLQKLLESDLTEEQADRYAARVGLVPFEVWPEMAEHRAEEYLSHLRRKQAENQRKRYQRDPEVRETIKARRRAYYAQCAEYERARERRRYAENAEEMRAKRRERYARQKAQREAA